MKKLYRAVIFFLCFMLLVLCSCAKTPVQTQSAAVTKTVTDTMGKTYKALVDEKGFLMCDEQGNLMIVSEDEEKNEQGELVTRKVSFPHILVSENEIYTEFFRVSIPENWKNKSKDLVKLEYIKNGKKAEIAINERADMSSADCVKEIEEMLFLSGEVKKDVVDFDFATATVLQLENKITVYVFTAEGRTYFVKVTADKELFETTNFFEIVNTIKFRKGE